MLIVPKKHLVTKRNGDCPVILKMQKLRLRSLVGRANLCFLQTYIPFDFNFKLLVLHVDEVTVLTSGI